MLDSRTELLYWLSIMRDHAMFHITTLSAKEMEYVRTAEYYRDYFGSLMDKVGKCVDWKTHKDDLLEVLEDFISFKKDIIKGLLKCKLEINLPPTFLNHMVNEAIEFHSFLTMPPTPPERFSQAIALIDIHRIWLADASGHAAAIKANLDPTESLLAEEAEKFKKVFDNLFIKCIELKEMLIRTRLANGALKFLSMEAIEWIRKFIAFLAKLKALRIKCMPMASGALQPLLADHMIREEQYYLLKIKALQPGLDC